MCVWGGLIYSHSAPLAFVNRRTTTCMLSRLKQGNFSSWTALMYASTYGHVAVVEALVAADPDPAHIRMTDVRLHVQ